MQLRAKADANELVRKTQNTIVEMRDPSIKNLISAPPSQSTNFLPVVYEGCEG